MRVPMKIVTLIAPKSQKEFLESLRELGLLHVQERKSPIDLNSLEKDIEALQRAVRILTKHVPQSVEQDHHTKSSGNLIVSEVLELNSQFKTAKSEHSRLLAQKSFYEEWGDFSVSQFKTLQETFSPTGATLLPYNLKPAEFKNIPAQAILQTVASSKTAILFISTQELEGFQAVKLPELDPEELSQKLSATESQLDGIMVGFQKLADYRDVLVQYQKQLDQAVEIRKVQHTTNAVAADVVWIQGFLPEPELAKFEKIAQENGWGYLLTDPTPDDKQSPPTKLKNPKWVEMIYPVYDFLNAFPGYWEVDISASFLVFFILYFAMLIGDAGYGVLFLLATTLFLRKKVDRKMFNFALICSISLIAWGAITGNWFGSKLLAELFFMKALTINSISVWNDASQQLIMSICIILAGIQLSLGHAMSGWQHRKQAKMIEELGWIAVVWGINHLSSYLILQKAFPASTPYLFGLGLFLIVFVSNLAKKKVLMAILGTTGNLPLALIGAFSDTVSYLRLFAVGTTSYILAVSFNGLGAQAGAFGVPVILAGHALNIVLCLLGVAVHGLRLNILEAAGHTGVSFIGHRYSPFGEKGDNSGN